MFRYQSVGTETRFNKINWLAQDRSEPLMNPPILTLEAITHQVTGSICKNKKTIKLHLTILKSYYDRLQYISVYKILPQITIHISPS